MKKLLLVTIGITISLRFFAQLPVNQSPENRNVILEENTGMFCSPCANGHAVGHQILLNNPGDCFLINIHSSMLADPGPGGVDFRTPFGAIFRSYFSITSYPTAVINRENTYSLSSWASVTTGIIAQPSYVNVACEANFDVSTNIMTVDVEAYFTGSGAPSSMKMNVAVTQDNIEAFQSSAQDNSADMLPNGMYNHKHVFRHLITGDWGDAVTTTVQGTLFQKQYTWTVPGDINNIPLVLEDLNIIAFISEGNDNTITGHDGPITFSGFNFADDLKLEKIEALDVTCGSTITPTIVFQNYGSAVVTSAVITYDVNGVTPTTFNWTGSLAPLHTETVALNPISFTDIGNNTINVAITAVNGGTDGDLSNNVGTKTITNTTSIGTGSSFKLIVTQDKYGQEITWKFIDAATGNPVPGGVGGPYSTLASASGTLAHDHNITLPNAGCYFFELYDSNGDGINSTYGAGNVRFEDNNGTAIFTHNGVFNKKTVESFEITSITGMDEVNNSFELNIYPNPTHSVSTISFNLMETAVVSMEVSNVIGNLVYSSGAGVMNAGNQILSFDGSELPNGIYFVNLTIGNQQITKKVSLLK